MQIDLTLQEIKMLEQRRIDLEDGLINVPELKALLNRIHDKLGKEPRKRKPKVNMVEYFIRNTKKPKRNCL